MSDEFKNIKKLYKILLYKSLRHEKNAIETIPTQDMYLSGYIWQVILFDVYT